MKMNRKATKFFALAMASALTLSVSSPAIGASTTATKPFVPAKSTAYPVKGSPKFSLVKTFGTELTQAGLKSYSEAPGFVAWQKQTGINVDLTEPADLPALMLLLAGGTIPDVILFTKGSYPGGSLKMADDGLAIDFKNKLADWAPDYQKFLDSSPFFMNSIREGDGSIRAFGSYAFPIGSIYRSWRGLLVRKEYMDKLGIKSIDTPDDLYNYLSKIKTQLNASLPFASEKNNFTSFFNEGAFTSGFGLVSAGEYVKDGKFHIGAYDPEYKAFLTYMNKLYTEKLLDNNFAVTDEATAQSSMIKGDTGAIYAQASRIQVMYKAANSKDFNLTPVGSLVKAKGDVPMFGQMDPYITPAYWSYITEKCKNVEAVMRFFNYMYTEQGNTLRNFGTEGVSFKYVDGKPTFTEHITKNAKGYSIDQILRVEGLINWGGIMDDVMSPQRFPMKEQVTAYEVWAKNDADKYKIQNDSLLPEFVDESARLWTDIDTYIKESRAKFISGTEPLANFDKYIDTLKKMNMDRYIEIRQKSYDKFNK